MSTVQLIKDNFIQSIEAKQEAMQYLVEPIHQAVNVIVTAFNSGNKILICGNGGSAADAQHLAAEFTGRYEKERRPLPAIALTTDTSALTAIGNDYSFDVIFSKQVEALGKPGDVLYAISTSGNSKNVIEAIKIAHNIGITVIAVVGKDGGAIKQMLRDNDVCICPQVKRTARVQEIHLLTLHTICDAVDNIMF